MYIHVIAIFVFDPKIVLSLLENKFRLIIAKIEMKKGEGRGEGKNGNRKSMDKRWIKKGGVKCTKIQGKKVGEAKQNCAKIKRFQLNKDFRPCFSV